MLYASKYYFISYKNYKVRIYLLTLKTNNKLVKYKTLYWKFELKIWVNVEIDITIDNNDTYTINRGDAVCSLRGETIFTKIKDLIAVQWTFTDKVNLVQNKMNRRLSWYDAVTILNIVFIICKCMQISLDNNPFLNIIY